MAAKRQALLLAGPEGNQEFWSLAEKLKGITTRERRVSSLDELQDTDPEQSLTAAILSTDLVNRSSLEVFAATSKAWGCNIIVAGSFASPEEEFQVRQAGIYCFLLLPDEAEMAYIAAQAATRSAVKER